MTWKDKTPCGVSALATLPPCFCFFSAVTFMAAWGNENLKETVEDAIDEGELASLKLY